MVLSELLVTLADNANAYLTLTNLSGDNIITFNASGYEAVESDLGAREVNKIVLDGINAVTIVLEDETP